jgi:quercetin dioxygenase-like cupin family protein
MGSDRYAFYPDLLAEAEIPGRGIHSQTLSDRHGVELLLFAMAPGEQLSEHTSARPAIIHVLSGEGQLTVDGDRHDVKPGSWTWMEARTPHALVAAMALVFALYLLPQGD